MYLQVIQGSVTKTELTQVNQIITDVQLTKVDLSDVNVSFLYAFLFGALHHPENPVCRLLKNILLSIK